MVAVIFIGSLHDFALTGRSRRPTLRRSTHPWGDPWPWVDAPILAKLYPCLVACKRRQPCEPASYIVRESERAPTETDAHMDGPHSRLVWQSTPVPRPRHHPQRLATSYQSANCTQCARRR